MKIQKLIYISFQAPSGCGTWFQPLEVNDVDDDHDDCGLIMMICIMRMILIIIMMIVMIVVDYDALHYEDDTDDG